jgi:hypothetical protein
LSLLHICELLIFSVRLREHRASEACADIKIVTRKAKVRITRLFAIAVSASTKPKRTRASLDILLVRNGFHPKLGMRPMRHAVEKMIGDAVACHVLNGGNGQDASPLMNNQRRSSFS